MSPSAAPPPAPRDASARAEHFRAYARRPVRLAVTTTGQRSGIERQAIIVDVSLAGAGLETDEALVPGERLEVAFATPTMWDPLVVPAVVAWAQPPRAVPGERGERDRALRPRTVARAGIAFEYADPESVLAVFEMLSALGYD